MSTDQQLRARRDVDNSDIPDIVERAERLRQQFVASEEKQKQQSTVEAVQSIGVELAIPPEFIEEAIEELRKEREAHKEAEQERQQRRMALAATLAKPIRIAGMVVGAVVLLRGLEWFWVAMDMTTSIEGSESTVVEERVIKETIFRTVHNGPASTGIPTQESEPVIENSKREEVDIKAPVMEEQKVVTSAPKQPEQLLNLKMKLDGEWVLDGYLLYEKGVEFPMMVPIVYEPLEVPKTWRFSSGKYKRVIDAQLGFSARFDVETLPDNLRPVVDDSGEWGQIIASNVVSTIPGIRRQNDYFAVLVGRDTLTIWYLGPNAYRKKLPSQAEVYRKR